MRFKKLIISFQLLMIVTPGKNRFSNFSAQKSQDFFHKGSTLRNLLPGATNRRPTESSLDQIREMGRRQQDYPSGCPFVVTENTQVGRIPSTFYEIECLHCQDCGEELGGKCTQLESTIVATYTPLLAGNEDVWTAPISIKFGCICMPAESVKPARIFRPRSQGYADDGEWDESLLF